MFPKNTKTIFQLLPILLLTYISFAQDNVIVEKNKVFSKVEIQKDIWILENSKDNDEIVKILDKIYDTKYSQEYYGSTDNTEIDADSKMSPSNAGNIPSNSLYSSAIPALIKILKSNRDTNVSSSLEKAFSAIGKDAVSPLIKVLKTETDEDILSTTAYALGEIGSNSQEAIPYLDEIISINTDKNVLKNTTIAMAKIGNFSVPRLIAILIMNKDSEVLGNTVDALGFLGKGSKDAVPFLIKILNDNEDIDVVVRTAEALGHIGSDAKDSIPVLFKTYARVLDAKDFQSSKYKISEAICSIIDDLVNNDDFSLNGKIANLFELHKNEIDEEGRQLILDKIQILRERQRLFSEVNSKPTEQYIVENLYYVLFSAPITIVLMLSVTMYLLKPRWLVLLHEKLLSTAFISTIKTKIEISSLPFITFVCLNTRSLDAWVENNLETLKENFDNKETIKEHSLFIPLSVSFDNKTTEFKPDSFYEVFDKKQFHLLIHGEGGSGKTSLVCCIAQWAIEGRMFIGHFVLPVLVENNVKDVQKAIGEEIKKITDGENKISDALQKALLRKKRILLIVDGLSELDETTKQQIVNNTEINAVIYTSRNDEIKDIAKIETNNVADESLYHFISTYIEKFIENLAEKPQFQNNEIHEYCANLSKLVGEKGISVLLAKLYAEQLVAKKEGAIGEALPKNIPELMLKSINVLHKKTPSDNIEFSDVIKASEIIANECLKKDYRPLHADKVKVKEALASAKISETILKYLCDRLKIIEEKGEKESELAFKIDPLAEYLAADYLVEKNGYSEDKWQKCFEDIEKIINKNTKTGNKNSIKGFLVAVKDCCEINKDIPPFVVEELTKLIESEKQGNEDKIN
jgi:HEAT repeat protein/DNA replication protein DnaC